MSENLRRYQTALFGFDAVARRLGPGDWNAPSKCSDWTCREVAGHVIWHVNRLAASAGHGEPPAEQPEADVAGPDPSATWVTARDRVLRALDQQGALASEVTGPFGPGTVDDMLRISSADIYTHTWDIGAAVGVDPALDPGIAEDLLPGLQAFGDGLRQPGLFGAEVPVADDSPVVDRYLAFTGRSPT